MGTARELRYSVYVVPLDEYVGTLPQMRLRNPERDPSKPFVYVETIAEPHTNMSGECRDSALA